MAVLATTAAVVLTAAPGTSAPDDGFRTSWRAAVAQYAADTERVRSATGASTAADVPTLLATYAELAASTSAARERFEALDAPRRADGALTAFTDVLRRQEAALRDVRVAAADDDVAALRVAVAALAETTAELARARGAVDAALAG